jgi:hypothetical protein
VGARILARLAGALLGQGIAALIIAGGRGSAPAHATEESPFATMMRESEERRARCRRAEEDCVDRIHAIDFDTQQLGRASCSIERATCELGP